jgi:DNA-binding MarR family transcriptional regulator
MQRAPSSLLLFNPSRASSDELEATFVGRKRMLKELEDAIRHDATGPSPRHWQIVGPRGSGKSHLTELLARRLAADGWLVARLPEEHYSVGSLAELLEEIVVRLLGVGVSPFAGEKDPRHVEERALDLLQSKRRESGRRAVAVIENLGLLLENQLGGRRDQARLRQILSKDPPVIVIATETSYIEATTSHGAPFYDFFQTVALPDLERSEVIALIQARARRNNDERLLGEFAAVRRRVEAIYHISGGSPRLVLALYSILRDGVTEELGSQLTRLLDEVTPYYQARLRDVSPQAARVIAAMALSEKVETPSELGRRLRLPTAQVSSIITRLMRDRYVEPGGRPDAKRRYYELSDRLFRIWLQMREGGSPGRERLQFVAEFFQHWYEGAAEELDAEIERFAAAFWRELKVGQDGRCAELLETLGYLHSAGARPRGDDDLAFILTGSIDETPLGGDALERLKRLAANTMGVAERPAAAYAVGAQCVPAGKRIVAKQPAMSSLKGELAILAMLRGEPSLASRYIDEMDVECHDSGFKAHCWMRYALLAQRAKKFSESARALEKVVGADGEISASDVALLRVLDESRREQPRARRSMIARALNGLQLDSTSGILLAEAACGITHDRRFIDLSERLWRHLGAGGESRHFFRHWLELMVRCEANGDSERAKALLDEMARLTNATKSIVTLMFAEAMPALTRRVATRKAVLEVFRRLVAKGAIEKDLFPYAQAMRVADSPSPERELASLHPEQREAVSLVMGTFKRAPPG